MLITESRKKLALFTKETFFALARAWVESFLLSKKEGKKRIREIVADISACKASEAT
jgi:hypothetical protein